MREWRKKKKETGKSVENARNTDNHKIGMETSLISAQMRVHHTAEEWFRKVASCREEVRVGGGGGHEKRGGCAA